MPGNNLGTIRGTIEIDYDGAGIVRAIKDTDKAKDRMGTLGGASDKVLGAFGKFAGGAFKVASAVSAAHTAVSVLSAGLAIVGPLAAAGFATAPALILGFASAMTIAKIAVSGVGDALAAAGGPADKFDKAIEKLSPQARAFARAYKDALPILNSVRKSIQDSFFTGAAGKVKGVAQAIASLKPQASGVAFQLGQIAQNIIKWATNSKSIDAMKSVLSGVSAFLSHIKGSIGPIVEDFISLGGQAGKFGDTLGLKVNSALDKLDSFLMNIDLGAVFAKAAPIIKSLGEVLGNVGSIFTTVFSGISVDGGSAASVLATITGSLAAFLHTAEGQAALQALGTALKAISDGVGPVFLALLQAIAPAIVTLAPGVAQLATILSGQLVGVINDLNPLLQALAGFLANNITWLEPIGVAVVTLAVAYKAYAAAVDVVNAVKSLELIAFVKSAAAWVASTAKVIASTVALTAHAVAAGAVRVATVAYAAAVGLVTAAKNLELAAFARAAVAWIASTAQIVANGVALTAYAVASGVVRVATLAWTAAQWLLDAAMTANPIGLVIVAIGALVAAIIWIATKTTWFQTIWGVVWNFLKAVGAWFAGPFADFFVSAWNSIVSSLTTFWHWILGVFNAIKLGVKLELEAIKAVFTAIWNFIVGFIQTEINLVKTIISVGIAAAKAVWTTTINAIKAVASSVWAAIVTVIKGYVTGVKNAIAGVKSVITTVKNAFNSAKNAASTALTSLVSTVKGIPGRVTSALGGLGSLLYNKGRSLIQGFINGIASMIGAVRDKASSIVHAVTDFLPGSPAKTGPLSGKGYALLRARRMMTDLAQGIDDGSQKPIAAMAGAINPLARATVSPTSTTKSGASLTPAIAPTAGVGATYQLIVDGKQFAEFVVDAVTGAPVKVSKAVNEGSRKSSWAGSGR